MPRPEGRLEPGDVWLGHDSGSGMIPVRAQIGETTWKTSLFPKNGQYIVPIRASVRKAETLVEGDDVTVSLEL
jgi:Domain of unknown function (DUF1905)